VLSSTVTKMYMVLWIYICAVLFLCGDAL